jgi:hypothetical protein
MTAALPARTTVPPGGDDFRESQSTASVLGERKTKSPSEVTKSTGESRFSPSEGWTGAMSRFRKGGKQKKADK